MAKVLVINCGSSSIKYSLFEMDNEDELAQGMVEKIGEETSRLSHQTAQGKIDVEQTVADHQEGFALFTKYLLGDDNGLIKSADEVMAVGHRVVHGGEEFVQATVIDNEVIKGIEKYSPLAPLHNPPNLVGIREARRFFPHSTHVAVFDTAFHHTLPRESFIYAIPYQYYQKHSIRRYGFHGTSHDYVSQRAAEMLNRPYDQLNQITAHLGNGVSITAIRKGRSVDTSMGMTPLEGLVMGTRSGDLDPGFLPYLAEREGFDLPQIDEILNKKSGLLGISGISNDMREIAEAAKQGNQRAELALQIFAHRAKKYIGCYLAILGHVDDIIFTAGIGENNSQMRARICSGLEPLGIKLDAARNQDCVGKQGTISADDSTIKLLVIPTNEELLIARQSLAKADSTR